MTLDVRYLENGNAALKFTTDDLVDNSLTFEYVAEAVDAIITSTETKQIIPPSRIQVQINSPNITVTIGPTVVLNSGEIYKLEIRRFK